MNFLAIPKSPIHKFDNNNENLIFSILIINYYILKEILIMI